MRKREFLERLSFVENGLRQIQSLTMSYKTDAQNNLTALMKALETANRIDGLEARMAKFEGSKADKALDKKGAKKAGVSLKKWEGSAADNKKDAAAAKKGKR